MAWILISSKIVDEGEIKIRLKKKTVSSPASDSAELTSFVFSSSYNSFSSFVGSSFFFL